jgi:hypothetical protein
LLVLRKPRPDRPRSRRPCRRRHRRAAQRCHPGRRRLAPQPHRPRAAALPDRGGEGEGRGLNSLLSLRIGSTDIMSADLPFKFHGASDM